MKLAYPELRVARQFADENGLTTISVMKFQRKRGFTVRIAFRGPCHRRGDLEVIWKLCRSAVQKSRRKR